MPVSATRQWRQNWGQLGSQGYGEQDLMYSVSMTSSMESSRDAFSMRHSEASQQVRPMHTSLPPALCWITLGDSSPKKERPLLGRKRCTRRNAWCLQSQHSPAKDGPPRMGTFELVEVLLIMAAWGS